VEWFARDLLKVSTSDALKILNDEYLEIRDRYPGEFALMAPASSALIEPVATMRASSRYHLQSLLSVG
jgi:hypothetical protein